MKDVEVKLRLSADGSVLVSAVKQSEDALGGLGDAAERSSERGTRALNEQAQGAGNLRAEMTEARNSVVELAAALGGIAAIKGFASSFIAAADAQGQLDARLRRVSESIVEQEQVTARLRQVAHDAYVDINQVYEVYVRSIEPMRQLGMDTMATLDVTEALSLSMVVSATATDRRKQAIDALSKSMQTGYIAAEQFEGVLAGAPRFVTALESALGKTRAELIQMVRAGELTIDMVSRVAGELDTLRAEVEDMPTTVEDAALRWSNAFQAWAGSANEASGATALIVTAIDALSANIDGVMLVAMMAATAGLGALTVQGANWTRSLWEQSQAAQAKATATLTARQADQLLAQQQQVTAVRFQQLAAAEMARTQATLAAAAADRAAASAAALRATSEIAMARASASATQADAAAAAATAQLGTARAALVRANAAVAQSNLALAASGRAVDSAAAAAGGRLLSLNNAIGGLVALGLGYELGTWARQFEVVRRAGDTLVGVLMIGWESIKTGAEISAAAVAAYWEGGINLIKGYFADLAGFAAGVYEGMAYTPTGWALGADEAAARLRQLQAELTPTGSAYETLAGKVSNAVDAWLRASGAIAANVSDLEDARQASEAAAEAQRAAIEAFQQTGVVSTLAVDAALSQLTASLKDQRGQLEEQVATYGRGRAATLAFAEAQALARAETIADTAERARYVAGVREAFAPLVALARQLDGLQASQKRVTDAQREEDRRRRDAIRDSERALQAQARFRDELLQLEAAVSGPVRAAEIEHSRRLQELEARFEAGEIAALDYYRALELLETQYGRTSAAARAQEDVIGALQAAYAQDIRLAGMSEQQRRIEIRSLREIAQYREAHGGAIDAETEALIRQIVETSERQIDIVEAAQRGAEEYSRIWADSFARVFDALLTGGKDAGKALMDEMKNLALNLARFWAQQRIIIPLQQQIMGGIGGAPGGAGGFNLGSLFGGGQWGQFGSQAGWNAAAAGGPPAALAGRGWLGGGSGMSMAGNALGAAAGIYGVLNNFRNGPGGVAGGLSGAASGAMAGSMILPGVGTIVGAIIGGLSGLFGGSKDPRIRIGDQYSDARGSSRLDDVIGANRRGLPAGTATQFVEAIAAFDNNIADLLDTIGDGGAQLDAVRAALRDWGVSLSDSAATVENVLTARFGAILSTFDADTQAFVRGASTLQEQVQRLAEVLGRPAQVEALLAGLREQDLLAGMSPVERQVYQLNQAFDDAAAQAAMLGASQSQLSEIEDLRARALARLSGELEAGIDGIVRDAVRVGEILDELRWEEALVGLSALDRQLAESARRYASVEAAAAAAGATEEELTEIREIAARTALRLATDARSEALRSYVEFMAGLRTEMAGLSAFGQAMVAADSWREQAIATANRHAQAAGLAAARESDLATIELRAAQMRAQAAAQLRDSIASTAATLGFMRTPDTLDALNQRIAELQQSSQSAASGIGRAVDTMREQTSLLLGDLSPYNDRKKLEIARAGLESGSVSPEEFLRIAQRLFGSTARYTQEFEFARQFAGRGSEADGSGAIVQAIRESSADTRSLTELIAARDQLQEQQRYAQAMGLARQLAELGTFAEGTYSDIAESIGFSLDDVAAALGLSSEALEDYLDSIASQFSADRYQASAQFIADAIEAQTDQLIAAIIGAPAVGNTKPLLPVKQDTTLIDSVPVVPVKPGPIAEPYDGVAAREDAAALRAELAALRAELARIAASSDRTADATEAAVEPLLEVAGATQDSASHLRDLRRDMQDAPVPKRTL